jgi:hypothetical protein
MAGSPGPAADHDDTDFSGDDDGQFNTVNDEEFNDLASIMHSRKIELSIISKYINHWTLPEAFRELVQNK